MSATKLQKRKKTVQTKKKLSEPPGFIVLQTLSAFFPGSRNKQFILDSYESEIFFLHNKSFINQACSVNMKQ